MTTWDSKTKTPITSSKNSNKAKLEWVHKLEEVSISSINSHLEVVCTMIRGSNSIQIWGVFHLTTICLTTKVVSMICRGTYPLLGCNLLIFLNF